MTSKPSGKTSDGVYTTMRENYSNRSKQPSGENASLIERLREAAIKPSADYYQMKVMEEAADALAKADEEVAKWAAQAMREDDCRKMWQDRAEAAERELEKAREALEWIAENSGDTYETNKGPFWVPDEAADRARAALEGKHGE